jgi:hypothetical protein
MTSTRSSRFTACTAAAWALVAAAAASASSHREAPAITAMPKVDATDFYMFRSYEPGREGYVTLIANYIPLQDAYGGPNYFSPDPDAFYDIRIDNDGDGVEDLTFVWDFTIFNKNISLPIGDATVAVPLLHVGQFGPPGSLDLEGVAELYTVSVVRGHGEGETVQTATNLSGGGTFFAKPLDNPGNKTYPDYPAYANLFVSDIGIPGCAGTGRVFVGQRKEPFAVNLGEIFDLVNLNPVGARDAERSATEYKNVTSFVLEAPIDCLTGGNGPVIGAWTTARVPRVRTINPNPTFESPATFSSDYVQVSRLGMPLVNEVVIGLKDKNLFNASRPSDDLANFATYVTNPTLPTLLQVLFGVGAPTNYPRLDLVAAFVTGVAGLNEFGIGEMQRLNVSIPPTPSLAQNNLGVLGGDNAGFPNGRRPGDDVVDAELRVAMGVLCHAFPGVFGCDPADAPAGALPYTDGALQDAAQFDAVFPYLRPPVPGSPNEVNGIGG